MWLFRSHAYLFRLHAYLQWPRAVRSWERYSNFSWFPSCSSGDFSTIDVPAVPHSLRSRLRTVLLCVIWIIIMTAVTNTTHMVNYKEVFYYLVFTVWMITFMGKRKGECRWRILRNNTPKLPAGQQALSWWETIEKEFLTILFIVVPLILNLHLFETLPFTIFFPSFLHLLITTNMDKAL